MASSARTISTEESDKSDSTDSSPEHIQDLPLKKRKLAEPTDSESEPEVEAPAKPELTKEEKEEAELNKFFSARYTMKDKEYAIKVAAARTPDDPIILAPWRPNTRNNQNRFNRR